MGQFLPMPSPFPSALFSSHIFTPYSGNSYGIWPVQNCYSNPKGSFPPPGTRPKMEWLLKSRLVKQQNTTAAAAVVVVVVVVAAVITDNSSNGSHRTNGSLLPSARWDIVLAHGLQGEGLVWLIGAVLCLHATLQVQLFIGIGSEILIICCRYH